MQQEKAKKSLKLTRFVNVQNIMNINHFEQLMVIFKSHRNEDGTTGFDIDKFREVFGKVLGDYVSFDQMTMLFMKIDANSDGTMDWDEFSTYMMTVNGEEEEIHALVEEKKKKNVNTLHRDMIIRIEFVMKERKYLTISRDGTICVWTMSMKLVRKIHTSEFHLPDGWVLDAKFIQDANRLVLITDNRQMCFFDLFSIRPRLIAQISQLEYNPMCIAFTCDYDENTDLIIYGDDGGYVNILTLNRRFLIENNGDSGPSELITPAKLSRKDSMEKFNMSLYRRKVHKEWVLKVMYYKEMNAFVSCSSEDENSLVMGDLERKTLRSISIPKGVETFEFCKRPSFLVTAGRDKTIRLWNPYVLSKPAGSLIGNNGAIVNLAVNNEEGIIISLSDDKVIKLWSARTLNCIQTLVDKVAYRPENALTALYYDYQNRQVMTGSSKVQIWPMFPNMKQAMARNTESPIVAALFNSNFNQVVSGFQSGSIRLWDPVYGEKIFEFHRAHEQLELTAMCFDLSGRRLITASRDKMWNFNNGQMLRRMHKNNALETTDVCYIEMGANQYIIAVGWDKQVTVFLEDNDSFDAEPVRILDARGTKTIIGHTDDISSVAFGQPNILATSSLDGSIIVWNLESGYIRFVMREPELIIRPEEEKAVEKVHFVNTGPKLDGNVPPLFSCHADGHLRIWNAVEGKMIHEVDCQIIEGEGLTTLASDNSGTMIFVGGSFGHLRIIDLHELLYNCHHKEKQHDLKVIGFWRAHLVGLTSCIYVDQHNMVLTGSKDAVIRLWSMKGEHVGTFGEMPWHFLEPSTSVLPREIQQAIDDEERANEHASKQKTHMKKKIINTWKTVAHEESKQEPEVQESQVGAMKVKALKAHIAKLFKEKWQTEKNKADWQINPELVQIRNSKQFFSYDYQKRARTPKSSASVKFDAVFHSLPVHPIEEISSIQHPLGKSAKIK